MVKRLQRVIVEVRTPDLQSTAFAPDKSLRNRAFKRFFRFHVFFIVFFIIVFFIIYFFLVW